MGVFLIAVGSFFMWYLWAFFQQSSDMDDWVETPCVVEKSEIDASGLTQRYATKYTLVIRYRYEFGGKEYVGDQFSRIQPASSHEKKIRDSLRPYPLGGQSICYVDPADPSSAVLKRDTKASVYSIWFPALFVVGGAGMILAALRKR